MRGNPLRIEGKNVGDPAFSAKRSSAHGEHASRYWQLSIHPDATLMHARRARSTFFQEAGSPASLLFLPSAKGGEDLHAMRDGDLLEHQDHPCGNSVD